jgi:hypothetical protein
MKVLAVERFTDAFAARARGSDYPASARKYLSTCLSRVLGGGNLPTKDPGTNNFVNFRLGHKPDAPAKVGVSLRWRVRLVG